MDLIFSTWTWTGEQDIIRRCGYCEAPHASLIRHCLTDENGIIKRANLISETVYNSAGELIKRLS
ncbi:hypothetical protein ACFLU4_08235 [Chloroflexota bacterium]